MAQKQIIWSGYAKRTVFCALESMLKRDGGKDTALNFFRTLLKKLAEMAKTPGLFLRTSGKDVYAFRFEEYLVLFESRESGLIIHSVSEEKAVNNS